MIGAIAGDIIGSIYEFENIKTLEFPLFQKNCFFTDDTVLTIALADALLHKKNYADMMKEYYWRYPNAGYGGSFIKWAKASKPEPYNSWGNGAAMRISPVAWAFDTIEEVLEQAAHYTAITHNHTEGIKGAQATAAAIYLARTGSSKGEIKKYVEETFGSELTKTCDEIRPAYQFDVSCQGTVPPAITAFLESTDFEGAVRLAVSLGGDTDTLACITGSIAEAYYGGVPSDIATLTLAYLDDPLRDVTLSFLRTCVPASLVYTAH